MLEDYLFAWEGASHPSGPWACLRVLEVRGHEALSEPYSFEIDLVRADGGPELDVDDLVGSRASLRFVTETSPAFRLVHGVIAAAEELGEVDGNGRYRVVLAPPLLRAGMMRKSLVFLDKTLLQILEAVLTRTSWGAGLTRSLHGPDDGEPDDGDPAVYTVPNFTFAIRCLDMSRLGDPEVRPFCVQYEETDLAFVSRLLEEEGISYHFEHTKTECVLVLSDFDGGRHALPEDEPVGPGLIGRTVDHVRIGARVRPTSASLHDYNWQKPSLDLVAVAKAGVTDFQTHAFPGRYEHSRETGEVPAERHKQRLDSERRWATMESRCRLLGAGTLLTLEHPTSRFSGRYLVVAARYTIREHRSFGAQGATDSPYASFLECVRCDTSKGLPESGFRPARHTPRPRILGHQTAIVTADPASAGAEIQVGGPQDVGSVRVRFHWDLDVGRLEVEPSSCWIRVSQTFAGSVHGAVFNPRVGEEVIVAFLDGDPDRPLVTGRVYNGVNHPAIAPSKDPTWSAIHTLTSPADGTANVLGFQDRAGAQEIFLHASRDFRTEVTHDQQRSVGNDDATAVKGNQSVTVDGSASTSAGSVSMSSGSNMTLSAKATLTATANVVDVVGKGNVNVDAPWIDLRGGPKLRGGAAIIELNGPTTLLNGDVTIQNGNITITGGTVAISGSEVTITGGTIKLN
jgi:type VI secretion system secreted protein VgrG